MARHGEFDSKARREDKARSRQADAEALGSGRVLPAQMAADNGIFAALDMSRFRIAAIGSREVARVRSRKA